MQAALVLFIFLGVPALLTLWNIFTFIRYLIRKKDKASAKWIEISAMVIGMVYMIVYFSMFDIKLVNWDTQLYNNQVHSMISPKTFPTMLAIIIVALLGYIVIRFVPAGKQSPAVSAISISAVYLGIALCVLWMIQVNGVYLLMLYAGNCIVIFIKAIAVLVYDKNQLIQDGTASIKYKGISALLDKAVNLPWIALVFTVPLLGILIAILFLFGQEPDSIIKAWTETADWTFSQKIPPQNIYYDEHYLCTVAAGGHQKVVKPIRVGMRHGHRVIVNRQLCIANAFEQVIEEKLPKFHKTVRAFYDNTGYPLSKHIHSKYLADIIYTLMKPLEWFFLFVLYLIDVKPENRIAIQYPHTKLPH